MENYSVLDKTVQRAVSKGYVPQSEQQAVRDRIVTMSKKYGFSPDEFAMFSMIETDGLDPQADNGNCAGIIQFCCLSIDTQILTTSGWKKYEEVSIGDSILSWNPNTQVLELDTIRDLHYYESAPVIRVHNKRFDFIATPNHTWYVRHYSKPNLILKKTTSELNCSTHYNIPRSSTYSFPQEPLYSSAIASLAGWVLTDGSINDRRGSRGLEVTIYQSEAANEWKCRLIEQSLRELNLGKEVSTSYNPESGMRRWSLFGDEALSIYKLLGPNKTISIGTLDQITKEQAELMYEACILGDGTYTNKKKGVYPQFGQASLERIEGFQLLCFCIDKIADYRPRKEGGTTIIKGNTYSTQDSYRTNVRTNNKTYTRKERMHYTPLGTAPVWCPETTNGTWIAKRLGFITITGNSGTGASTVGYDNYQAITNLSTLQQLELVDQYFSAQGGPYGNLEDLYLTVLYPAARDVKDPNQCLGIPGKQADYLYDQAQGCITKNSIRAGLTKISQEKLGDLGNIAGANAGAYTGLAQAANAIGNSTIGGSVARKNCPAWNHSMSFGKVTTGCDMSGALGFGSGLSLMPGGTQGVPGAAGGPANLTNIPVNLANLAGSFPWPVRKKSGNGPLGEVNSPYGMRKGKMHQGVDMVSYEEDINGAPLIAIAPGVVVESGMDPSGFEGYGNVVFIQHERPGQGNIFTLYAHLIEPGAAKGSIVQAGTVIGKVGSTGFSTGPHLHFEIRQEMFGGQVDPEPLLTKA